MAPLLATVGFQFHETGDACSKDKPLLNLGMEPGSLW